MRLSEAAKDLHFGSGVGVRRSKRNHSMELGTVRKLNRRIWTNARTAGFLGVNPVQAKNPGQTTVQTLETSEEARGGNGGVDQPKRNDKRLASLDGERELIADDDARHRVTERTNVQQSKRHEDEYSSQINVYTISSCRGVRV